MASTQKPFCSVKPFGRGRDLGNRLALAGAGEIDHRDIAGRERSLDRLEAHPLLAQQVERLLHIRLAHRPQLAPDGQGLVFGQLEFRGRLDRGRELQRLAAAELDLLDVGMAQHIEFLLFHGLAIGLGDQLALRLFLDVLLVHPQHHLARRFAWPKAGQLGLAPEIRRHRLEGFIHLLRFDFHPHQLLARGQTFYCHIHKQTFPLVAENVQWAG